MKRVTSITVALILGTLLSASGAKADHPTHYCQVDAAGNPTSQDQASSVGDELVDSLVGGCVTRPISEVWAVLLNQPTMKPDRVDGYEVTARPDLVDPNLGIALVFDILNSVKVLIWDASWTVRWYHSVRYGTIGAPNEVWINFQKISGTGHIRQLFGEILLDRVTDQVTSFVIDQKVDADQYSADDGLHDVQSLLERVRTGQPDWSALPKPQPIATN